MFKHGTTLVLGSGTFADRVADALTHSGQSLRRMPDADGRSKPIRAARLLVLAEVNELRAASLAETVAQVVPLGRIGAQSRLHLGSDPEPMPGIAPANDGWRYLCWPRAAARILLNRYPLHFSADVAAGQAPRLLILGFGAVGLSIAVQAMRLAHYGTDRLRIDVLCAAPEQAVSQFADDYPQAHRLPCDLQFHDITGEWPAMDDLTAAYIALDDDRSTLDTSLATTRRLADLLQQRGCRQPPLFPMLEQAPVAAPIKEWDGRTYPFLPLF
jgi:hypothetical protein